MDHSSIRTQIPALVSAHVPRNVRSFKFRIYEDLPQESSLGVRMDPQPFEGKIVAKTDQVIVVKIGRAEFAVLDRHQVSQEPDEGTKVQVQPYVFVAASTVFARIRPKSAQKWPRTARYTR